MLSKQDNTKEKDNALNTSQLLAESLTYAGTLPLAGCALLLLMGFSGLNFHTIALAYGAVIVAFLSGIHWGLYLTVKRKPKVNLFISSNVLTLVAFAALLFMPQTIAYLLLILCFLGLLALDGQLNAAQIFPRWFYDLRRNATVIVVLSLLILIFV